MSDMPLYMKQLVEHAGFDPEAYEPYKKCGWAVWCLGPKDLNAPGETTVITLPWVYTLGGERLMALDDRVGDKHPNFGGGEGRTEYRNHYFDQFDPILKDKSLCCKKAFDKFCPKCGKSTDWKINE